MTDGRETFNEQIGRLGAMSADERGSKWDLSPNDRAAIGAAVVRIRELEAENAAARKIADAAKAWRDVDRETDPDAELVAADALIDTVELYDAALRGGR